MLRRTEDPKRLAAEQRRDRAQLWLEILSSGIGHAMQQTDRRYYPETMRGVIERVNGELCEAVDEAEAAEKAYEPYWRRRSRRMYNKPKKKAAKKAKKA